MGFNVIIALSTFTTSVLFMYWSISIPKEPTTRFQQMMQNQENYIEGNSRISSLSHLHCPLSQNYKLLS